MTRSRSVLTQTAVAISLALAAGMTVYPGVASGQSTALTDLGLAQDARDATLELDVERAGALLNQAGDGEIAVWIERGRLGLYTGDCAAAAEALGKPSVLESEAAAMMIESARGCERATAATVTIDDEENGLRIRLQDDDDRALVPYLVRTAVLTRASLSEDLGVDLPRPIRIELVRDQFTLAAMTGLPLEAAQTTGTVAIAKWGRVIMLSPRASSRGYPYLDTLAHELTHLALSRGTRDHAPLWLQEGVAKRQEIRWRKASAFDRSPDGIAAYGLRNEIGPAIDKIGPSIAMLGSPQEATVTFAKVHSFMDFWIEKNGHTALPNLLTAMKNASGDDATTEAMEKVSGKTLSAWADQWRATLASIPDAEVPTSLFHDASAPLSPDQMKEVSQRFRLGELLAKRGHAPEAATQFARAQTLSPEEAAVRCGLADALVRQALPDDARPLVERAEDVRDPYGRWYSLHGSLHPGATEGVYELGIALDALNPAVACAELAPPAKPTQPERKALCETARRMPVIR